MSAILAYRRAYEEAHSVVMTLAGVERREAEVVLRGVAELTRESPHDCVTDAWSALCRKLIEGATLAEAIKQVRVDINERIHYERYGISLAEWRRTIKAMQLDRLSGLTT